MRAIVLGLLASFFFAFTFVLNRAMELSGGSWIWSASLRYFFMAPLLLAIVLMRRNWKPLWEEMRRQPGAWVLWSFVGFVLFYAPICLAAAFGPGWLVAGTWQITIVCGSLLVPLFYEEVVGSDGRVQRVRHKIPWRGMGMSLIILLGVLLMQVQNAHGLSARDVILGIVPVVVAAFAYPLGNRKMMQLVGGRLDSFQRTLGMTLMSLPFWLLLSVYQWSVGGAPSGGQTLQSFLVALSSGVVATVLFFAATDLAKGNPQRLAAVEATQAGEVVFTVLGEIVFLSAGMPSWLSWTGMVLVMLGMVLHSLQPLGRRA